MNPAKNLAPEYNPIDTVENIFSTRSFELERRSLNEVVVEVQGKWNNMLLFLPGNRTCAACIFPV